MIEGGYNFNPVMRLFGYRFYEVKDRKDVRCLLISQTDLQRLGIEVQTRRISHDVYVLRRAINEKLSARWQSSRKRMRDCNASHSMAPCRTLRGLGETIQNFHQAEEKDFTIAYTLGTGELFKICSYKLPPWLAGEDSESIRTIASSREAS